MNHIQPRVLKANNRCHIETSIGNFLPEIELKSFKSLTSESCKFKSELHTIRAVIERLYSETNYGRRQG